MLLHILTNHFLLAISLVKVIKSYFVLKEKIHETQGLRGEEWVGEMSPNVTQGEGGGGGGG